MLLNMFEKEQMIRHEEHWIREDYKQRITTKEWKTILLNKDDSVIFKGRLRKLIAKNLGVGVVEIFKEKKEELKNGRKTRFI